MPKNFTPTKKQAKKNNLLFYLLPICLYFLLCILPTYAEPVKPSCPAKLVFNTTKYRNVDIPLKDWDEACRESRYISSFENMLSELQDSDVIYLGETHDNKEDHQNQLTIIKELHNRQKKMAIAMEMFQRPYQDIINQYLANQITAEELVKKSEYEKRWGFPWENYAPILRLAKEKQLPVIALNTPSEITRKVARQGLESLTTSEQKLIPPLSQIRTDNEEYRHRLQSAFQQHQTAGHGNSGDFERFFQAQVLWDETMAESIANFVKANPNYQVVVLAGQGHIIYGHGIPNRVARRLKGKLTQRSVLLSVDEDTLVAKGKQIADFVLISPKSQDKSP